MNRKPAIKIEKKIPMPTSRRSYQQFPFAEMKVGDSFFVSRADRANTATAASWYGTRNNMKFSVRNHDKECRCWRIA